MTKIIEEKTPKGISIKVMIDKWMFLAFDKRGGSIYADSANTKVLHHVPFIVFVGTEFIIPENIRTEVTFLKNVKEKMIIPYSYTYEHNRRYVFIPAISEIDIIPAKIKRMDSIADLVRDVEKGVQPDYIIVDKGVTRGDIIVIKNRFPSSDVVLADTVKGRQYVNGNNDADTVPSDKRAADILKEVNLNMMSDNPVFLARIHLRELALSKTNQLLLDFDLSADEAEYILSFIETMVKRAPEKKELMDNISKIHALREAFYFYIKLMQKDDAAVRDIIQKIDNPGEIVSCNTLIAKIKPQLPEKSDQLMLTEYENILYEKAETLRQ
jgi:hypothetical protein